MKTKLLLGLSCAILCFVWIAFGSGFALNFSFAFLSFSLIILGGFYTQKKKILSLINNSSKEELEALIETYKSKQEKLEEEEEFFKTMESQNDSNLKKTKFEEETQEISLKKHRFWDNFSAINVKTGIKIFFLPLRLLTYGILIVGILILIRHQLFNIAAFFSGLMFANIFMIFGATLKQ